MPLVQLSRDLLQRICWVLSSASLAQGPHCCLATRRFTFSALSGYALRLAASAESKTEEPRMKHQGLLIPPYSDRFWNVRASVRVGMIALAMFFASLPAWAASDGDELAHQAKAEYQSRRHRLMEQVRDGIVVLIGAQEDEFGEVGRFRQKNDFMYLTGCETPAAYLMLVPAGLIPDRPAEEVLFIPPRNMIQEKWTGPQVGPGAEAESKYGFQTVVSSDEFYPRLVSVLMGGPFKPEGRRFQAGAKLYTLVLDGSAASITREAQFIDLIHRL